MTSTPAIRLEAKQLTVRYGDFVANDRVDLALCAGEVHAVLGENGAGKSTLMNVLIGLQQPSGGQLERDGLPVRFMGPQDAAEARIGMVHQHSMLVERVSVVENIALGLQRGLGRVPLAELASQLQALAAESGFTVDPWAAVENLSPGERQRVEILKLLHRQAEVLILDEPTSVLAPQEVKPLLLTLRRLADAGRAIVLITHKLDEVAEVADRITVLRGGRVVVCRPMRGAQASELARCMVGSEAMDAAQPSPARTPALTRGDVVIAYDAVMVPPGEGRAPLQGVTLSVHQGEIVGVAGVDGNGQQALADALAGLVAPSAGHIRLCGTDVHPLSARARRNLGLAYIPEDRHHTGLVLDLSVAENLRLHDFQRRPWVSRIGRLRRQPMLQAGRVAMDQYDIKARDASQRTRWLSGGNQQKIVLARELSGSPRAIVVSQPCKGLDLLSTRAVHEALRAQQLQGAAILYISTELEHLLDHCDRIVVLSRGRITGEVGCGQLPKAEAQARIGELMAGAA
ncbi:ABC transporter ATP-binding protein [Verminephrobacter aporrectodeae subsp. tuberculatae]|uniref:ABC transporter ATP-binding protein n=1 Tax=Verminephrobacter aporrectodeae TaxID=1110389 RepID=UPI0022431BAC|nr:ABC transporter ATP-binding protein [Verminephrobacter aporrectodeae]MCW8209297.1 ABC transporter ATP-binding protein [Verminephrobacter aporrectodeae subsp. tuberculatae]